MAIGCVCVTIKGGLGNQLYQLAYADFLRRTYGYHCCIVNDWGIEKADILGKDRAVRSLFTDIIKHCQFPYISPEYSKSWSVYARIRPRIRCLEEERAKHAVYLSKNESRFSSFPPLVQKPRLSLPFVYRISGYFQSYKYNSLEFRNKIREFLEGIVSLPTTLEGIASALTERSVAIHFRRGDFLKHPEIYKVFGAEHYLRGLNLLAENKDIDKVYVFSDDFDAIESDLEIISQQYNLVRVEGGTVYEDLYLLSCFKRYVLAGSTFSWWGAFCSQYSDDIEVVVPRYPLKRSTSEDTFFPPHWIQLEEIDKISN